MGHPGQEVWKGAETDVSCHPWVQQLRADMKALWTLSPAARQSLPSSEEPGCESSWLTAAKDERKWRDLVGSLHLVASTFDKKEEESRVKRHPIVSPWTCSKCEDHFISEMTRDQHARSDGAISRGRLETHQHVSTAGRTFGSGSGWPTTHAISV